MSTSHINSKHQLGWSVRSPVVVAVFKALQKTLFMFGENQLYKVLWYFSDGSLKRSHPVYPQMEKRSINSHHQPKLQLRNIRTWTLPSFVDEGIQKVLKQPPPLQIGNEEKTFQQVSNVIKLCRKPIRRVTKKQQPGIFWNETLKRLNFWNIFGLSRGSDQLKHFGPSVVLSPSDLSDFRIFHFRVEWERNIFSKLDLNF